MYLSLCLNGYYVVGVNKRRSKDSRLYLNIYKWAQERGVHKVVFSHLLLESWDKPQVLYIFGILRPSELKLWCRISRFPCQNRIINGFVEWVRSSHAFLSQIRRFTVLLYRAESSV